MQQYVLRRLVLFIPTMVLVSLMIFALLRLAPGDAIDARLASDQMNSPISAEERAKMSRELGLDKPLYVQYAKWMWGAVRFDFGNSFWRQQPNLDVIKLPFTRTLELALLGLTIGVVWGVTSGVISAVKQDTWIDYAVRTVTVAGLALPSFFISVMVIYALVSWFNWIPPIQFKSIIESPRDNLMQMAAPALILGLSTGATISRLTRSQLLDVIREDYIRTARSKGLREKVIILRHALRNSLLPVVTAAGLILAGLMGGTVILEQVFAIPGMGTTMISAINTRDYPLIQTVVWMLALAYMTSNLLVDISYAWLDPRIRYK